MPSAKGYLAILDYRIFVPQYIVLSVIEVDGDDYIIPLGIEDLAELSELSFQEDIDFTPEIKDGYVSGPGFSSELISEVDLVSAARHIYMNGSQDLEYSKNEIIEMANKAQIKCDDRVIGIPTIDYCKRFMPQSI